MGAARASKQQLYPPLTLVPFNQLGYMATVAEQPVQQPGPVLEPSLVLGPLKTRAECDLMGMTTRAKSL